VAQSELQKLASTPGITPINFGEEKSRGDALVHAKRFAEAVDIYRDLLERATPTDKPEVQLALAESLNHSGHERDAKKLLESVQVTTPEAAARRFYDIGEMQRAANDDDGFLRTVDQIRQTAPTS